MSGEETPGAPDDEDQAEDAGECDGPVRPRRPPQDPRKYVASWSERDSLDGRESRAWVLILRTSGCSWARCSMCGYHGEAAAATADDLLHQFGTALQRQSGEEIAKVYTSGSFLDGREVPPELGRRLLTELSGSFKRVIVESRPEFVTEAAVKDALSACPGLEIAMGLESASPRVLEHSVRKGFTFADFERKAGLVRRGGGRVRAYLLLKPPFLNEAEALEDTVQSALLAAPLCDTVSINPVNIQRGTVVEQLWRRRIYRPPWLWTAAEAVLRSHRGIREAAGATRLVCAPTAGGRRRGAHNCGQCDDAVLAALEGYSLTGSPEALEQALARGCGCRAEWMEVLEMGAFPCITYDALVAR
jgi:radical SAM enzyme (TIGR01210 family)